MVEHLEFLIRQSVDSPEHDRCALFRELLRSETFLLNIGPPVEKQKTVRLSQTSDPFMVWADKDPELGGVWVPLFAASDAVSDFVSARGLEAPKERAFLWMGFEAGQVFRLLLGVECFAGIKLHVDPARWITLGWTEVKTLSAGRVPAASERYEMPVAELTIPDGVKVSRGSLGGGEEGLLSIPAVGKVRPEELRKLVKLDLGQGVGWMPCRHFIQVLRLIWGKGSPRSDRYLKALLESLIGFEMYGEAESLCRWLGPNGDERHAWKHLAFILAKTGRAKECVQRCRRGIRKYPQERAFPVCGARALLSSGLKDEAREMILAGLETHPGDEEIEGLSQEL